MHIGRVSILDVLYAYFDLNNWSGSVIITSLGNILKNEGFRGMYRGLSPNHHSSPSQLGGEFLN